MSHWTTALWPAAFSGAKRSCMASNTWLNTVSTPAAVTNSLISSSDRPSSNWARASGLLVSLRSLTGRNTTDHAERLLRRLRPPELHGLRALAHRRADPSRRLATEPRAPPPRLCRVAPLRHAWAHEPARPRRPLERHRVARLLRPLGGRGGPHPRLPPVLGHPDAPRTALADRVHCVDRALRPHRARGRGAACCQGHRCPPQDRGRAPVADRLPRDQRGVGPDVRRGAGARQRPWLTTSST